MSHRPRGTLMAPGVSDCILRYGGRQYRLGLSARMRSAPLLNLPVECRPDRASRIPNPISARGSLNRPWYGQSSAIARMKGDRARRVTEVNCCELYSRPPRLHLVQFIPWTHRQSTPRFVLLIRRGGGRALSDGQRQAAEQPRRCWPPCWDGLRDLHARGACARLCSTARSCTSSTV